jgi:hypothetical protein
VKPQELIHRGGWASTLIELGARGVHPLFDSDSIRRAFARIDRGRISEKGVLSAHLALRELSTIPDVYQMRKYLKGLPIETVDLLVYMYFRCLDEFLESEPKTMH